MTAARSGPILWPPPENTCLRHRGLNRRIALVLPRREPTERDTTRCSQRRNGRLLYYFVCMGILSKISFLTSVRECAFFAEMDCKYTAVYRTCKIFHRFFSTKRHFFCFFHRKKASNTGKRRKKVSWRRNTRCRIQIFANVHSVALVPAKKSTHGKLIIKECSKRTNNIKFKW